jgi:spore coat polysaccharide biosynthesis protein SpsF (cytidylyltransferase family)
MTPLLKIKPDIVVRITGDDILIDNYYFQKSLNYFLSKNLDYVDHKELISGTETEIFDFDVLNFIYKNFQDLDGTEYLTNYIKNNSGLFNIGSAPIEKKHILNNKVSMTIDTFKDYKYVKSFIDYIFLKNNDYYNYTYEDIYNYCKNNLRKIIKNNTKIRINTLLKKNSI